MKDCGCMHGGDGLFVKTPPVSGGTAKGPSHDDGGITYKSASGRIVELEGKEPVIPEEAFSDPTIRTRTGTNKEIIAQILKKVGVKLSNEVTRIKGGDIIICIRSTEDKKKRSYTGTDKQILSAINESGGCRIIESGAKVKEVKKNGGAIGDFSLTQFLNQKVTLKQLFK